jgi:WXG100 family type VII secretion target
MSITVKYEELQGTSGQLRTGREEITTNLTRLRTLVDGLVQSGFVTDLASGRFQQSYLQWNTGATNVIQGLEGMSTFLDQAIARHQQLDSELGAATGA